jgi:hypothetical protein
VVRVIVWVAVVVAVGPMIGVEVHVIVFVTVNVGVEAGAVGEVGDGTLLLHPTVKIVGTKATSNRTPMSFFIFCPLKIENRPGGYPGLFCSSLDVICSVKDW